MFEGQFADSFFAVFDDGDVGADLRGLHSPAERHGAAGSGLQTQGHHFQRVGQRQRFIVATGDQRAHLRKAGAKTCFESGQVGDLAFIFCAVDKRFDSRVATPQIGAT